MLVAVFCLPITLLDSLYNGWRYGAFLCKATPYLQGVSVCASVNFLAAIAVDRYLAICYTLEHKMTWRIARTIVFLIWTCSLCIMIPWALFYKMSHVCRFCGDALKTKWGLKLHEDRHLGLSKYSCCDKQFSRKEDLTRHM
ncbi:hypothetical protein DPMN_026392 [Dreissena polymorpha]|uniref:G-protein coupled receptors family 1 profile domain-containing protein n=1 Tax=Dreissena polymorpha TaxID=45954 RepID=A0A9D4LR19_DREPO|nr:hypothetical protein DPMN_026392 [Dreissena polymorpha]